MGPVGTLESSWIMLMLRFSRPCTVLLLGLALLAPLPGCDRGDDVTPPIVVVTPEPVRGIYVTAAFSGFNSGLTFSIPVELFEQGKLDITVDWTEDETWMFVYFSDVLCGAAEFASNTCPFIIASETKDPKPRVLLTGILEPKVYYLYLTNVARVRGTDIGSDVTEAVAIEVGLTVGFGSQSEGEEPVRLGRPRPLAPPAL